MNAFFMIISLATVLFFSLFPIITLADDLVSLEKQLDNKLEQYIADFNFAPVERVKLNRPHLLALGTKLYGDLQLSVDKTKSCFLCHHPQFGTTETMPFSPGIGMSWPQTTPYWRQLQAKITKRKSPSIYNRAHPEFESLFIDGRVSYDKVNKKWITPDQGLNNKEPGYEAIANTLDSVLAAQSLFPIADKIEMRGSSRPDLKTNLDVWNEIANRIKNDPAYSNLLGNAYPNEEINMGHLANAMAYFQKQTFQVTSTKWDKYLRAQEVGGDLSAMSIQEKRGAVLFAGKARCANCHSGKHLTDFSYQNSLIPRISQEILGPELDMGLYHMTNKPEDAYKFKVSPLRNIVKTVPYFHNGAAGSLREVIEHYNKPIDYINNYDIAAFNRTYYEHPGIEFTYPFYIIGSNLDHFIQLKTQSPKLSSNLGLTKTEMDDLEVFLKEALMETQTLPDSELLRMFQKRRFFSQGAELSKEVNDIITPIIKIKGNWKIPDPQPASN